MAGRHRGSGAVVATAFPVRSTPALSVRTKPLLGEVPCPPGVRRARTHASFTDYFRFPRRCSYLVPRPFLRVGGGGLRKRQRTWSVPPPLGPGCARCSLIKAIRGR